MHCRTHLHSQLLDPSRGYARILDSRAAGQLCPACGTVVETMQYLGGACCFCLRCQV